MPEGRARRLWKSLWYVFHLPVLASSHIGDIVFVTLHASSCLSCFQDGWSVFTWTFPKVFHFYFDILRSLRKMKLLSASTSNLYRYLWKLIQPLGLSCAHLAFILISQVKSSKSSVERTPTVTVVVSLGRHIFSHGHKTMHWGQVTHIGVSELGHPWLAYKLTHDDVIKWKHFPRNWPFVRGIHRSPVNSPHKGQWRRALMFSLICVWMNDWVNNREAGDLRRYCVHYDVLVMCISFNMAS